MRVNDFKYHKSKDSKEFDIHTGELLYYVDEPDTIYSTQNEKEFIEQVLNEIDERREQKRMMITELEQRKRTQIMKDTEKKEQQRMKLAAEEQRKQEYIGMLRHEIISFKDNITTNINIKEITWFIKNCLGYHMEQFHIVFDYRYTDGDDSETKTVDINITYLDVECLRNYLHIYLENLKNELVKLLNVKKLSKNVFEHVKVDKENVDLCSICRMEFDENKTKLKKCNHSFHNDCILSWFKSINNYTCPLCRAEII
jgi:hypothetical protein